jgi:alpha-1,3-rhamnosyl/mannosyltransferase
VTRLLVRHAARIVVPSPRTKAGLVERFGMDPDRVDVTPLAPRTLPDVVPARGARPYLLAVGTVEPRKNLARTVEAHRRAVARGLCADLVVVGARGWLFDDVDRAAGRNPLARFEGEVDDARLSALYRGAAALVYPSLGEGYGLPVAEAMSLGVPVVTSAGTACQDLGGDAVLAVDPYDVEALSDAVERVATDAALARRLAALGRAQASAWSWAGTAAATRASYARAAG